MKGGGWVGDIGWEVKKTSYFLLFHPSYITFILMGKKKFTIRDLRKNKIFRVLDSNQSTRRIK